MVVRIRSTFTDIQHLFLLVLYIHLISALRESSAKLVYGTQGGSITFHLEERPKPTFQDISWTFSNRRLATCDLDKCTTYTEKASVCNTTFSLELKDIAQADDGDYTAVLVGKNGKVENISNHRLTVQAPVSKPVIHTSAVSSSDGRCNVTLNCTAERGTGVSLQWDWTGIHHTAINAHNGSVLYFSLDPNADGSFTCKAHNQVSNSSENVSVEKIKCFNSSENTILVIIIVAILASVLLTVAVVTMAFQKHRRADNCNVEERTDVHGDLELEDSKQDIPRLDPDQIAEGVFDVEVVQVKEEEMEVSVDHVTQEEGWKTQTEDLKVDVGPRPDPVSKPLSKTDPVKNFTATPGTAVEDPAGRTLNPHLPLLQQIARQISLASENRSDNSPIPSAAPNSGLRLVGAPPGPIRLVRMQNREVRLVGWQEPALQTQQQPIRLLQMQNKEVRLVAPGPGVVRFQTRPAPQDQNLTGAVDSLSPTGQRAGIRLVPVRALPAAKEELGGLIRVNLNHKPNPESQAGGSNSSSRGEAAAVVVGLPNATSQPKENPANRSRVDGLDLVMAYRSQLPKTATPSTLTPAPAPAPAPRVSLSSSSLEGSEADDDEEGRGAKNSYICTHCGNSFSRMSSLHRHQDTLHPRVRAPSYPCPECGKNFTDSGNLRQHWRIHTGEKPYSCGDCGLRFRFKGNLNSHQCVDEEETPFSCQVCGKNFRRPEGLERHVAAAHREPGAGGYECVVCGKRFWNRELLKSHGRVHTVQKPYWCQECGKRFRHLSTFNYHKRTHLREAPHRCDKCGRAFADQEALEGHSKVHGSEAPFRCEVCGNGFRLRSHFRSHQRIHSGETPYDCAECGRSFSHLGALRFHVQNHERGKKEEEKSENGKAE